MWQTALVHRLKQADCPPLHMDRVFWDQVFCMLRELVPVEMYYADFGPFLD